MDIFTIALLLGAAGVGGAVGAAASAVVAGNRVAAAFTSFEEVFEPFFDIRQDPESRQVVTAFDMLKAAISGMGGALGQLKRAMKIR